MATRIRLRRMGAKKTPFYRIVVADGRCAPAGRFIEAVGWYDPRKKQIDVNRERVSAWLGEGARLSNSVGKLLKNFAILTPEEIQGKID